MQMFENTGDKIPMQNRIAEELVTSEVVDIEWERIIVHITVKVKYSDAFDKTQPLDFYLVAAFNKANAKFKVEQTAEDTFVLTTNVTNPGYNMCIPTGTYTIYCCQGTDILCAPQMSGELAPKLQDKSRTFLHNNKSKGYVVNFSVTEDEEELGTIINVMDMSKSGLRVLNTDDRPEVGANQNKLAKQINKHVARLKKTVIIDIYKTYHWWFRHFDTKKKHILFWTEQSETIGTNIMAVHDRMKARSMEEEWEFLYSARSIVEHPGYGVMSWVRMLRKMAKANVIIVDDHAPILDWLELYDDTRLIQIWHAGAGFKSSGYSRWGHTGCPAPYGAHRQYDYGIAGSKHIAHFFSEVWGINTEQVLPTGMPRMDEYLDPLYRAEKEQELEDQFPLIVGKKVILFAPTYRGKNRADAHYPYDLIDFQRLYDFCGDEYVVLFKMHPWVPYPVPIKEEWKDKFVDANKYPNINDLFYKTDLLITDYSSNIFEYSLMLKPMLFFAFDEIQYSFSRGFHRDYKESAPGKVCHTFDELMTAMETGDYEYEKVQQYVDIHFDYTDSGASDRVIDWLVLGNVPEEFKANIDKVIESNNRLLQMDFSSLEPVEENA